jgi:glycosyltransferase involved in cell wall biosynthesis
MNLSVSIIIPAYNAEKTIVRALKSCVDQKMQIHEVIVVDNNSIDDTISKAQTFDAKLPLTILLEKKPGASAARNFGLRHSTGKLIQFLDADDELLPNKILAQLTHFKSSEIAFVAGNYSKSGVDARTRIVLNETSSVWLSLFEGHLGITSSNLWRKSAIDEIGGWNESLKSSQEADLMFRLLNSGGKCAVDINSSTIVHQDSTNRISTANKLENARRFLSLRLEMIDWIRKNQLSEWKENQGEYACSLYFAVNSLANHDKKEAQEFLNKISSSIWRQLPVKYRLSKLIKFSI